MIINNLDMLHSKELFIADNLQGYNHLFFNSNESYINDTNKIESAFEIDDIMSDSITEHNTEIFDEQMD
jgi:hypothetical protein